MPHKPDTPCATCGKLLWSSSTSLPAGQRICRPCRKAQPAPYGRRDGSPTTLIACPVCETPFSPSVARVKTCSRRCGQLHRKSMLTDAERAERRRAHWQAKNRRRRAVQRGADAEPYTLAEIAERDRRRCQLCRRKVNMTLSAPHPRSPSIDHVIPIAEGGGDTRANVQLAHRGCNSSKGARGSQQLALVG